VIKKNHLSKMGMENCTPISIPKRPILRTIEKKLYLKKKTGKKDSKQKKYYEEEIDFFNLSKPKTKNFVFYLYGTTEDVFLRLKEN
jgi:hypothetical protein